MATEESARLPATSLLGQMPVAVRQTMLLVGLAAAVAVGVASALWLRTPSFSPLYTGLVERDVAEIVNVLEGANIPYRLESNSGAVLVPADSKYEVRMEVAAAGLPRGGGFGMEEIPEMSGFGQSPFIENALYVQAIQTELSRTISTLQPVEAARVHLAVPQRTSFLRDQRTPSASVTLRLFPGRRLEASQAEAIANLVASSVPELEPQRVTVLDQTGRQLTTPPDEAMPGLSNSQLDYAKRVEDDYAMRIESLLAPIVGSERVRASVAAEIDFTVAEETSETFNPNVAVVRSEEINEETRTGDFLSQGVPGALSNQPPETLPEGEPVAAGGAAVEQTPTSTTTSQVRNFELDKTVSHVKQASGVIQRLSVAVLIDNKPAAGGGPGEPLTQEELDSLTDLSMRAVGFDEARGDTISVLNSAFQTLPAVEPIEPPGLLEQPFIWDMARQGVVAVLVLVLALVIVRPMVRQLTTPQPALFGGAAGGGASGALPGPAAPAALPMSYTERVEAARDVANNDPRQVADVVRNWVAEDNG
ncbi:MAG: flagellar M-ring protein FliF [Gammaproteobacteria bacterium]|nr:flagellar M-ring protein FliF [Gammaproteobacteria bacterium]